MDIFSKTVVRKMIQTMQKINEGRFKLYKSFSRKRLRKTKGKSTSSSSQQPRENREEQRLEERYERKIMKEMTDQDVSTYDGLDDKGNAVI